MRLTRREFFKVSASASGGLLLAMQLPGCGSIPPGTRESSMRPNAWLEITKDSRVIMTLDRVEMGQGTYTGMATLLAEELDTSPESIEVVFAPVDPAYVHPEYGLQATGGSSSIRVTGEYVKKAGATGKAMLIAAAAQLWEVKSESIKTVEGICHGPGGQKASYGALVELAAKQSVPSDPPLKPVQDYRYVGKFNKRLDANPKTFGKAEYGIDTELPGMVYAALRRPPVFEGTVKRYDASQALSMPGVLKVVEVSRGVAVIAERYWQARKALQAVEIEFAAGEIGTPSDDDVYQLYADAIEQGGDIERDDGDIEKALTSAEKVVRLDYKVPFLAHAPMEPMNCTAWVRDGQCDLYVPTQAPDIARAVARRESGLSASAIQVHTTFIGGGFGRRLTQEYVAEAVSIAMHTDKPVKLIWSREDDMRHGPFRPSAMHRLTVSIDSNRQVTGWKHSIACPRILDHFVKDAAGAVVPSWTPQFMVKMASSMATVVNPDASPTEGALRLPYTIPSVQVIHAVADAGIPVTYWRSVGHSHNAFAMESFVDEVAHALNEDEVAFRDRLLDGEPRHRAVLHAAAGKAGWGKPLPKGRFHGMALHESFFSYVAQVAEVSIEYGQIKVHKVVCAVDCGQVVNPDMVITQLESGIIFGLTATLHGNLTLERGAIKESNFHDYPVLRMNEAPEIDVILVSSDNPSSGVGEVGVPPIAPAVANAVFKATGKRLRQLPLKLS